MKITEEALVAQKVVISEGMQAAQESRDSAPYRAPLVGYSRIFILIEMEIGHNAMREFSWILV